MWQTCSPTRGARLRTTVTVHYQTARHPSQRSISAAGLERYAEAIRAELAATADVLAAQVDATATAGGTSVYLDVAMDGSPPEVIVLAMEAIWAAVARAQPAPDVPRLEKSTVRSITAHTDGSLTR